VEDIETGDQKSNELEPKSSRSRSPEVEDEHWRLHLGDEFLADIHFVFSYMYALFTQVAPNSDIPANNP
jgi:hypothetical protein